MDLIRVARSLARETAKLEFAPPVAYIYNPLRYAWARHQEYLERYGSRPREALLLGMNPGPFGMAQTGVPFGDPGLVAAFLGIEGRVGRPVREHPKRPVNGFSSTRGEVSGRRLWSWAQERFGTADRFFERFFVVNYCPLVFIEEGGRNRTPDKLPVAEQAALFDICDRALRQTVELLQVRHAIGIGAFAEARIKAALGGFDIQTGRVLHPSPASPAANRGWAAQAERQLALLGLDIP